MSTPCAVEAAYQLRELRSDMTRVLARIDRLERAAEQDEDRRTQEAARLARRDATALADRFTSMRQGLAQRAFFAAQKQARG